MKKICQEDTGTRAKGMGRIYIDVKEGIISGQDRSKWRIEIGRKKKKKKKAMFQEQEIGKTLNTVLSCAWSYASP